MEQRCPNCGTPGRPGARFCTTCGFRFPGDESETEAVDVNQGGESPGEENKTDTDDEGTVAAAEMIVSWPSPSAPAESFSSSWGQPAVMPSTAPSPSDDDAIVNDANSTSWPGETADPWPAPPDAVAVIPVQAEPSWGDSESEPDPDSDAPTAAGVENAETMQRAMRLLDELRDTVAAMGPATAADLSGVISDLEVAVTPPGAMAADDLAELREALLAARERPRDVDTIVDLTKRIEAMVALVIAYDRTIAAIERSLEALRG